MAEDDLIQYFIAHTDKRFDELTEKVDSLRAFRWQIIGGSVVLSVLFSSCFALLLTFLQK